MLATLAAVILAQASVPAPSCRTSGSQLACGYHCRAELGEAKCSQTPEGICQNVEDRLVCWDPPEEVRLHATAQRPSCKKKFGEVACGYACATSPTKIACAQTPWGSCTTRYDQVVCWDPAPATIHHFTEELAGVRCVSSETSFACGWDCKRSRSEVRCAQTPRGTCAVNEGKLVCFDPPVPAVSHPPAPTASSR